ncbi:MAG: hypothetical protein H3C31_02000 [Brumimicrobium sp.]|nr:hypothetical protein [Brumimicrobium sp.]
MQSKWFFFFFLAFSLISCKDKIKETYIIEIEKMVHSLDSLQEISENFDKSQIDQMLEKIHLTLSHIKSHENMDTISYVLASQYDTYKDIPTTISINSGNLAKVKVAIPEVKEKLEDLKHDIQNGINERDKYEEFLEFERNKVKEIETVLEYYTSINQKYILLYDSLQPIMEEFNTTWEIKE